MRKLIIDEYPINPKYYDRMSELLDVLIEQRRQDALEYAEYLKKIVELTKRVADPSRGESYPASMNTSARRSLYDNVGKNEALVLAVDMNVRARAQAGWGRGNAVKTRMVRNAIREAMEQKIRLRQSPRRA